MADSWHGNRPKKLTRYEMAMPTNDELIYDAEFGTTDKYYTGERE